MKNETDGTSADGNEHPNWGFVIRRFGGTDFTDDHDLAELHESHDHADVSIAGWSLSMATES